MEKFQIIRPAELAKILSCSKQTIWRLEKRGELPPRIKISSRAVGWKASDIEQFIEDRATF